MLIRHSTLYFIGRILPGAFSLLALAIYTRLISANEYGQYVLVIASMSIVNAACFGWLNLSLDRFFAVHIGQPKTLLSTILVGFLSLCAVTGVIGACLAWLWPDSTLRWVIVLTVFIAWAQAWFELNLRIANVSLAPRRYGLLATAKTSLTLGGGLFLFYLGFGVIGILFGQVIGTLTATLLVRNDWGAFSSSQYDASLFRDLIGYGLPAAVTIMLVLILDVSDRFLLGWLLDAQAAGKYAAAYDLTQQSLGALMGVIHLAGFPLAVRALEEGGLQAAREQLRQTSFILLSVALPATAGTILLTDNIAYTLLGAEFRSEAARLIPYIAIAVFFWGTKLFYFDYAFQLTRRTKLQVWPVAFGALINIFLNLLWIPKYGLLGAASATLVSFVAGAGMTWFLGQRIFSYPALHQDTYKIILAVLTMALGLWASREWRGSWALICQISIGIFVYLLITIGLNTNGTRSEIWTWIMRRVAR